MRTPPRSGIGGASGAQYPFQTRMDAEKANLRQLYTKPVNFPEVGHAMGRAARSKVTRRIGREAFKLTTFGLVKR